MSKAISIIIIIQYLFFIFLLLLFFRYREQKKKKLFLLLFEFEFELLILFYEYFNLELKTNKLTFEREKMKIYLNERREKSAAPVEIPHHFYISRSFFLLLSQLRFFFFNIFNQIFINFFSSL